MSIFSWEYRAGVCMTDGATRLYRCEAIKAQMELNTKRRKNGNWCTGRYSFFLDGNKKEFKSEQELLEAINGTKADKKI